MAKLKASELKVGSRYLHRNGLFVRKIENIDGHTVFWRDDISSGQCSKQMFVRQCPSPAPALDPTITGVTTDTHKTQDDFTVRDEANALTAFAFRNGFLEDLHAGKPLPEAQQTGFSRISDDEMKRLMIEASEKVARLLKMKQEKPQEYEAFIRKYLKNYCRTWKRD